ncbi:ABC transporter [Brevibacillus panacihumi W25]|uniref:ABC transporter n=1 Tax=Brevibacillus panacihumi W25 TaxID=1408254 RepID=V6MDT1_9BACL|nr:ABC transporter ATP-binding protein [Brevibacillus panacihumi]EST56417.1 ABC transporter [Brevibacillus panacihumi W25]
MRVQAENISVTVDKKKTLLQDVGLEVLDGETVGLIGPNGSGKSSLLKSIYRVLKPEVGLITLDGEDVYRLSTVESAKRMAVVRQESSVEFDFTVREMVFMGRAPHKTLFQTDTAEDERICAEALAQVGMGDQEQRSFFTLSGGEKQRVMIARALAQQAKFLVLDEPTNHLDVRYQLQIMDLVKRLGMTVLAALHDLNMAAMYCDRLYVMDNGKIVASGRTEEVLSAALIRDVFGVEAEVVLHPRTGKKHIVYFSEMSLAAASRQKGAVGS